ncbi:hypothetical protein BU23DRAFT_568519 [Bimuria novae-zelandiae CBS 107.79]|uniref:C2H2-type domain-containing protein n=1 Tax=Bimuria novae-zelandiae CBS 107.79 TaxID=1447943 RepID=A0A6A5VDW9_9PLEO|nr:hypothetical protein BU23DRAFT_568519 [Bimuria novae-zelandiae CBS 107.79]
MGRPQGNNRRRNAGAPQAHPLSPGDIESRRAKAQFTLQSYTSRPLDDRPIMRQQQTAIAVALWRIGFHSVQKFVVLGPEEYEYRRTVNSASTVIQCWRELIAQADSTVLLDKRREDPRNFQQWRLKFIDHTNQRGQGPVFEICQRAADIPCQPSTRVSFHGILLLAAIGGFRRATIASVKYRDVCLAVVRDPNDRSKTKLVVTPTIGKNKLKRASRVSRALAISFSMTLVPYSPVCLASIIAARAIKDDAFKVGFESVEALLSRPSLKSVDFLPLDWKEEMLDRPIFNLSNGTFYDLWHRTCLVSGLREDPRFYTMRVGAGGRLDAFGPMAGRNDDLFQSLRSMSLSRDAGAPVDVSSEDLGEFEKRRDMQGLRADLEKARQRGSKEIRPVKAQIENLIETLSHLKLQEKRAAYFEHVDSQRAQGLSTAASSGKMRSSGALSAVAQFLQSCARELEEGCSVEQRAQHYMELLVDHLARRPSRPPPGPGAPKVAVEGCDDAAEPAYDESVDLNRTCTKQSRYLLCNTTFRGRSELTKHCRKIHVKDGTFDRPFSCPECLRLGMGDVTITRGPPAWSSHAEASHGKMLKPNLPSIARPVKGSERCLLCECFFVGGGGLWKHTRRIHHQNGEKFAQPFSCPECLRQGKGDASIGGFDDWKSHVLSEHAEMEGLQPLRSRPCSPPDACYDDGSRQGSNGGKRKRTRDDADADPTVDAAGGDWPEDTKAASDTTCTTPATATDSMSSTQTPASSVELENIRNIDPRLLPDHLKQGDHLKQSSKKVKSSLFDDPEAGNSERCVSAWETKPGPIVLSGSGTELEDLEGDCIPAADPQPEDHGLSYTGSLDAELHEPMIADCFHPQGQEVAEILESPPSEEFTTSAFAMIDLGDSHPHGMSPEGLSPTYFPDDVDVRQIHVAKLSQYPVEEEKEIGASPTSALTPDPEDPSNAAKLYWGRGYALVPEGCELNRTANNAQRCEEISSNISSQSHSSGGDLLSSSVVPRETNDWDLLSHS